MKRLAMMAFALVSSVQFSAAADRVVRVVPGYLHSCALTKAGEVFCWGMEWVNGTPENNTAAQRVQGLPKATSLTAGHVNSCIVDESGAAWCWGLDLQASVAAKGAVMSGPKPVQGLPPVSMIASGYLHTCAITKANGEVWCWGANPAGEIGDGTNEDRALPVRAGILQHATSISTGMNNSCATLKDGAVFCWGTDLQTGEAQIVKSKSPVRVGLQQPMLKISNGRNFFCGLTAEHDVTCFGSNIMNQLGDRTLGKTYTFGSPSDLASASDVGAAGFFGCALMPNGSIACWGHVPGTDEFDFEGVDPQIVPGIAGALDLGVGYATACVVTATGSALCWGNNQTGQVGNGETSETENFPVGVKGLPTGNDVEPSAASVRVEPARKQHHGSLLWPHAAEAAIPEFRQVRPAGNLSRLLEGALSPAWWQASLAKASTLPAP